jgi:hypothetical protein
MAPGPTCLEVRDLLPELAVGVLPLAERDRVERHLRWCAGCRKEAGELGAAAATFGFALAPVTPAADLGDRVVERVRAAAGRPGRRRRIRAVATALVAGALAVGGLGWGAVMASRAERFADRAAQAEEQRVEALRVFERRVLTPLFPSGDVPSHETHLGQLYPTSDGEGGGAALELVSPTMIDFSIVIVNGFDPKATDRLPYRVELLNPRGRTLRAGLITSLDDEGGAEVYHQFDAKDLAGYTTVRVVDANGATVLRGTVDQST